MSDTDDTDALLVIPPNFFFVDSDDESSLELIHCRKSRCVADFGSLKNKLSQSDSNSSYRELSNLNTFCVNCQKRKALLYKNNSNCDTIQKYTQIVNAQTEINSCGHKGFINQNHSLFGGITTMCSDISSITTYPSGNEDRLLTEIDNFLSKTVAGFEREKFMKSSLQYNVTDNIGNKQIECAKLSNKDINSYNKRNETENIPTSLVPSDITKYTGVTCNANEEYKMHIYNHSDHFITNERYHTDHNKPKLDIDSDILDLRKFVSPKNISFGANLPHICFKNNSSRKIDEKLEEHAINCDELKQHESVPFSSVIYKKSSNPSNVNSTETIVDNVHSQISLDKLWGPDYKDVNMENETEKLRREHCEQEIKNLQSKVLELQEKLAVAIQIDKAKDSAINHLKTAWQRLATNFENKDRQMNMLQSEMQKERSELDFNKQTYLKSCETHKEEINNSYELVKSLKQKIVSLEKSEEILKMLNKNITVQNENHERQLKEFKQKYSELQQKENEMAQKQEELLNIINSLRSELDNERKKVIFVETKCSTLLLEFNNKVSELNILKEECDELKSKILLEQEKSTRLEVLKRNLNNALDGAKLREGNLLTDLRNLKNQLEAQKRELKAFYQKQVETIVKDKMQEFQTQLEYAEKLLETEAQKREQVVTEKYNKQIQCIAHQNELEINLLKEKQKEEIELYRLQLKNSSHQIGVLKERLNHYNARHGKIAEQLHKVMENQWQAALQIITSPLDKKCDYDISQNNIGTVKITNSVNEVPEMDNPTCDRLTSLNSTKTNPLMLNSTPVLYQNQNAVEGLETYMKKLLVQPPFENINSQLDWPVLCQSTPKFKNHEDVHSLLNVKELVTDTKPSWK